MREINGDHSMSKSVEQKSDSIAEPTVRAEPPVRRKAR